MAKDNNYFYLVYGISKVDGGRCIIGWCDNEDTAKEYALEIASQVRYSNNRIFIAKAIAEVINHPVICSI